MQRLDREAAFAAARAALEAQELEPELVDRGLGALATLSDADLLTPSRVTETVRSTLLAHIEESQRRTAQIVAETAGLQARVDAFERFSEAIRAAWTAGRLAEAPGQEQ